MAVSILHRVTGAGLALVGVPVLVWWLWAAADGRESYDYFVSWAGHWAGIVVGIGLTWAFLQKTLGGIRHLVMDVGAGFELQTNKRWSVIVIVVPLLLTALLWAYIFFGDQL